MKRTLNRLNGIHILGTGPHRKRNGENAPFRLSRLDIAMIALSALLWRKHNGPIHLFTDHVGLGVFQSLGVTSLWNKIDATTLEAIPDSIDQSIFWAAPKLYALKSVDAPVAMIDLDLFVWKNLSGQISSAELAVYHREGLWPDIYIPKDCLKTRKGYSFDKDWDWNEDSCNTAFAYFSDTDFKNYYISKAMDFMDRNLEPAMEGISQMVFAEQRILGMCAKQKGIQVTAMLRDPYQKDNDIFTHIWGGKDIVRNDAKREGILFEAIMKKIQTMFPDYYDLVEKATLK